MFLVTHTTVLNAAALDVRSLPRRFFGRVTLLPRSLRPGLWLRVLFEVDIWRYLIFLAPFVVAMLIWQRSALAIAQAPLPMFAVLYMAEKYLLRSNSRLVQNRLAPGEVDRGLDLLQVRAKAILTRIAAGRGLAQGRLHLVIEQSDMARIAPLTYVSVQSEDGPAVLRLSDEEQGLIRDSLFQLPLTEQNLLRINCLQGQPLRDIALEASRVSGHARLAALMAQA